MKSLGCFVKTDKYINYLDTIQKAESDQDIKNMCAGVAAISAATVYEIAIKNIFMGFAAAKHKVLHNFTSEYFDRINGRIMLNDIEGYIKKFGEKYSKRFRAKLEKKERKLLKSKKISIKSTYGNLMTWRHTFVHEQKIPATFDEVRKAYSLGQNIIACLEDSMRR